MRLNEVMCLLSDETGNVVSKQKLRTSPTIQKAADRRKDEISVKFKIQYNPEFTIQRFSWYRSCFANYINEERNDIA